MSKTPKKYMPHIRPLPAGARMSDASVLIATWFGSGRLRPAPGTLGSLAALPFGYLISVNGGIGGLLLITLAVLIIGTFAATRYGEKSGEKDDQSIVVDEVVGLWIAGLPAEGNLYLWLAAFFLFRLFDVIKPWPASFFDKRGGGGFDVMMDDVIAGIYAFLGVATLALLTL